LTRRRAALARRAQRTSFHHLNKAESVVWLEVTEETTEGSVSEKGSAHLLDKAES
jgi:hypothetical protein